VVKGKLGIDIRLIRYKILFVEDMDCKKTFLIWKKFIETGKIDSDVIRPEISESWERCLINYKLDPYATRRPIRLSQEEIVEHLQKYEVLMGASKPFLQVLESAVRGSGFIITLADKDGYVLEVLGDKEILKMAVDNNYLPGCRRTENEVGTNAIGLSLYTKKAVQVTGYEHFNVNHHSWTCSSSPIFTPIGEVLGAITLSGKSIGVHLHTLGMVISAAKAIENKIGEEQFSREKDRLNSYLDSLLDSISEGIIAIKQDGGITHINRIAERMLHISKEAVIGRSLKTIVDFNLDTWQEVFGSGDISDQEVSINLLGKPIFFILSTKPIFCDGKIVGRILRFTEKQRVHELIYRFTGGNSRFTFNDIIGGDPKFLRQIEFAKIASKTDSRVLLVGESGTGKELFAQAIHNESKRRNGPFVAVSCAAVPRELIEAELFGYKGGAFTGSRKGGQIGKFELADKGTLFLDEISSMPLEMQAKILRVLQENEVVRLGDNTPRKVDARIITATNKNLLEEVKNGNFREDLYFRLNVVEIAIPPLRDRLEDLPLLSRHILKRIAIQLEKDSIKVSEEACRLLKNYRWPGNVRELENYLERASITCEDGIIKPKHLPKRLVISEPSPDNLDTGVKALREEEKTLIMKALKECKGNISESARKLQISRSTLYRHIKELGLSFQKKPI
jgi:transcriptional regulator of acetoin/glycerol metabolism